MIEQKNWGFETKQLHVGQEEADTTTGSRAVPIYQTTAFVFKDCDHAASLFDLKESGNIYTRIMNPTHDVLEKRMAALEGGIGALAVASGMSATLYCVLNLASSGDNIVAANTIYGGSYNLFAHSLRDFGIKVNFVNPDTGDYERLIDNNTKAIFIESLGNPNSNIIDIEYVAKIAHKHSIPLIVDNTFATPYLLRPIEYGADIVVHSATKFLGGHGNSMGGIVVDSGKFDWIKSGKFPKLVEPCDSYHGISFAHDVGAAAFITRMRTVVLRDTGACLSPFNAFLLLLGVETLSLRVERHVENALKVLDFLKNHPKIKKINHPSLKESGYSELYNKYFPNGAASIFSFELKGGKNEAKDFISKLKLFSLVANVADVKSLVIHPASTTHSQLNEKELIEQGITSSTIRLSIGTESIDDIIADLSKALS